MKVDKYTNHSRGYTGHGGPYKYPLLMLQILENKFSQNYILKRLDLNILLVIEYVEFLGVQRNL